jgi:hypothetical protein
MVHFRSTLLLFYLCYYVMQKIKLSSHIIVTKYKGRASVRHHCSVRIIFYTSLVISSRTIWYRHFTNKFGSKILSFYIKHREILRTTTLFQPPSLEVRTTFIKVCMRAFDFFPKGRRYFSCLFGRLVGYLTVYFSSSIKLKIDGVEYLPITYQYAGI